MIRMNAELFFVKDKILYKLIQVGNSLMLAKVKDVVERVDVSIGINNIIDSCLIENDDIIIIDMDKEELIFTTTAKLLKGEL